MKNYVQEGENLTFTAPSGGVVSGQGYLLGNIFGIVANDAAEGEEAVLCVEKCYRLPKAAVSWSTGAKIYWDNTAKKITNVATSNKFIGIALADAASGDTAAVIRIGQTADSNLDVSVIADVVAALEALTGVNRLSAHAIKDGATYGVISLTDRAKATNSNAAKTYANAHTVTAGEATAGQVDINTGFAAAPTIFLVQVLRAGVDVKADAIVTALSGGDLGKVRIADGASTYTTTENDVIHLLAIKV